MSYDYDWCGHLADEPNARPCGAPIERWSREWKHRSYELDADHPAKPAEPVGPLEEGLWLRADRYATALAGKVAADERIAALTELLRQHEYYRSQAESTLQLVADESQIGKIWLPTGPEPEREDANALLCLTTGQVFRRRVMLGGDDSWVRAELDPHGSNTGYVWPIDSAGPFIMWRDAYGFDRVLREAQALHVEHDELHRAMYSEKGYRAEGHGFLRPRLSEALERIRRGYMERSYEANQKAQTAEQMLRHLRRQLENLTADDVQQVPTMVGDEEGAPITREVHLVDLEKVYELLAKASCGGAS
jgi:hypothetical protein